jgi:hypothetical protein
MTEEEWVRQLRILGDKIDETAASMHPSAWDVQLRPLREEFEKLAKAKTTGSDRNTA